MRGGREGDRDPGPGFGDRVLMARYRIDIEYDGHCYAGWQRQLGQHSIQAAVETAIAAFSGETVRIRGAGRTDAGVHALGQVAHLDLTREWPQDTVRDAVNAQLRLAGESVSILGARRVSERFDARFSAIARYYVYRIMNRRAPPALEAGRAWWVARRLDEDAMHDAGQLLVGKHDFTTFRSAQCQARSPVRTLSILDVRRSGDLIEVHAAAPSFLHNQVRSLVGSLKKVGEGAWTPGRLRAALEAKNRSACGPVAPPHGLYLVRVDYGSSEDGAVDRCNTASHQAVTDQ